MAVIEHNPNDIVQRLKNILAMSDDRARETREEAVTEIIRLRELAYESPPGQFSPDGWTWKQAFTAEKARRVEAEAAIETLHEKYAQERISRSRQTLSDNTKMENQ